MPLSPLRADAHPFVPSPSSSRLAAPATVARRLDFRSLSIQDQVYPADEDPPEDLDASPPRAPPRDRPWYNYHADEDTPPPWYSYSPDFEFLHVGENPSSVTSDRPEDDPGLVYPPPLLPPSYVVPPSPYEPSFLSGLTGMMESYAASVGVSPQAVQGSSVSSHSPGFSPGLSLSFDCDSAQASPQVHPNPSAPMATHPGPGSSIRVDPASLFLSPRVQFTPTGITSQPAQADLPPSPQPSSSPSSDHFSSSQSGPAVLPFSQEDLERWNARPVRYIPSALAKDMAPFMSTLLDRMLARNANPTDALVYFAAPILILNDPGRSGSGFAARRRRLDYLIRRFQLFKEGNYGPLISSLRSPSPSSFNRANLVRDKVKQGNLSAAASAMRSTPLLYGDAVIDKLRDLHPRRTENPDFSPILPFPADAPVAETRDVVRLIKDMAGKSAGPYGFSASHLRSLMDHSQLFIEAYTRYINRLIRGSVPEIVGSLVRNALLLASDKGGGNPRPIGIRCSDARVAAHIATRSCQQTVNEVAPAQFGLRRGSTQSAIHFLRAMMDADFASFLSLDLSNAHNSASRRLLTEMVKEHTPQMYPLWKLLYEVDPTLLFRSPTGLTRLFSQEGGLQGDPMIAFAFVLLQNHLFNKCIEDLRADHTLLVGNTQDMLISIQDDSMLFGEPKHLALFIDRLIPIFATAGLTINPSKCSLYLHPDHQHDNLPVLLPGLKILSLELAEFCKSPISSSLSAVGEVLKPYLDQVLSDFDLLHEISDPKVCYLLLTRCISLRVNHWMRSVPSQPFLQVLEESYISRLRSCFSEICGFNVNNDSWDQARFPIRFGGLGLTNYKNIAPLAFLAAQIRAESIIPSFLNFVVDTSCADHLRAVAYNGEGSPPELPRDTLVSQRELSGLQHQISFQNLLGRLSPRHKARLLSCMGSGFFLHADPGLFLEMPSMVFRTALSYRLGSEFYDSSLLCPDCNTPELPAGMHAVQCRLGKVLVPRHNRLVTIIDDHCRMVGLHCHKEARSSGNRRPGDIVIPLDGKEFWCDVSITNPANDTNIAHNSDRFPLAAATCATHWKQLKYAGEFSAGSGKIFVPLVAETYGSWSKSALAFFRRLISVACHRPGVLTRSRGELNRSLRIKLDTALQTFNAFAIARRDLVPSPFQRALDRD